MKEKCFRCERPSKGCIPYLMSLQTPELCDWLRMWKERFGWSNIDMAEKSGVPKGTVDRVLGHNEKGVKLFTIRPMICAITGCTMEELEACEKDNQSIELENEQLRQAIAAHDEEVAFLKNQMREKDRQLTERGAIIAERGAFMKRKDRIIAILALLLAVTLSVIVGMLILDATNSNIGFFWR